MATITQTELKDKAMNFPICIGLFTTLMAVEIEGTGSMTTGYEKFSLLCGNAAQQVVDDVSYATLSDTQAFMATINNILAYVSDKVIDFTTSYPSF